MRNSENFIITCLAEIPTTQLLYGGNMLPSFVIKSKEKSLSQL